MLRFRSIAGVLLAAAFQFSTVDARAEFDADQKWLPLNSADLFTVESPEVEALVRIEMVKRARSSIDILTYDQRSDEKIGKPLLYALRDAANRGVRVRFLSSHFAMALREGSRKIQRIMTEPPTLVPVEFHLFGGPWMLFKGWKILDGVHEKIFVVDHNWGIITGRGHGEEYLNWVDTGFIFRGRAVAQFDALFQKLWKSLEREGFFTSPRKQQTSNSIQSKTPFRSMSLDVDLQLTVSETKLYQRIIAWMDWQDANSQSVEDLKMRVLHFDFIDQMALYAKQNGVRPLRVNFTAREEILKDPIVDEVEKILLDPATRELKFYSLSVTPSRRLKQILLAALSRGIRIEIITNSQSTFRLVEPLSSSFGWFASLGDIDDLLHAGARIFVYKVGSSGRTGFVHRKLVVSGDTVLLGSHNMNRSSSTYVDEMMIEVKGMVFANEMRRMFRYDALRNAEEISYRLIHPQYLESSLREWLGSFVSVLF